MTNVYLMRRGIKAGDKYAKNGGWDGLHHMIRDCLSAGLSKAPRDLYWMISDDIQEVDLFGAVPVGCNIGVVRGAVNPVRNVLYDMPGIVYKLDGKYYLREEDFEDIYC